MTAPTVGVDTLAVAEVFGPTIQGEGPSTGRRASFIRLGGCNLSCRWCDTPYTWDASRFDLREQLHNVAVDDIADRALLAGPGLVVVTGGEPLLHQNRPGWLSLLRRLAAVEVEVETNGTLPPSPNTAHAVSRFNVSPKLAHSGDPAHERIRAHSLRAWSDLAHSTGAVSFKFVARDVTDVETVRALCGAYDLPASRVWIMPEGTTPDAVLSGARQVVDAAVAAGFNVTARLHTLLWGDERGR